MRMRTYAMLLLGGAVLALLTGAGVKLFLAGKAAERQKWERLEAARALQLHEHQIMNRKAKENALENQKRTLTANAAAADRARAASERLQHTSERSLFAARADHAACVVAAAAHAELFNQCREEYQRLGRAADAHATDAKALTEAWPK
jgi:hypothetical protein